MRTTPLLEKPCQAGLRALDAGRPPHSLLRAERGRHARSRVRFSRSRPRSRPSPCRARWPARRTSRTPGDGSRLPCVAIPACRGLPLQAGPAADRSNMASACPNRSGRRSGARPWCMIRRQRSSSARRSWHSRGTPEDAVAGAAGRADVPLHLVPGDREARRDGPRRPRGRAGCAGHRGPRRARIAAPGRRRLSRSGVRSAASGPSATRSNAGESGALRRMALPQEAHGAGDGRGPLGPGR